MFLCRNLYLYGMASKEQNTKSKKIASKEPIEKVKIEGSFDDVLKMTFEPSSKKKKKDSKENK